MRTSRRVIKVKDKNREKKFFKPMVATSLALALGVSVGGAQTFNGSGDISSAGTHEIQSGSYSGNIFLPTNSQSPMTINIGTISKVIFSGNVGGKTNGSPDVADLTVNFLNGSTMSGNIQTGMGAGDYNYGNDFSANIVTFQGSNSVVLTGNIVSYGTGPGGGDYVKENGNHVTFTNGSMNGNIEAFDTNSGSYDRRGYNEVSFSANEDQTLTGNIIANGGVNSITFSGTGNKTIIGNISASNRIRLAWNEISSTATMLTLGSNGSGSMTSTNNGFNKIETTALTLSLNSIIADGNGDSANYISATNSVNFALDSIVAGHGGYNSKNFFEVGDATLSRSLSVLAKNISNNNTEKLNILKFKGSFNSTNSAVITELSAVAVNQSGREKSKNILSFESLTSPASLTIQNINKTSTVNSYATGNNYIGKALTSGDNYQNLALTGTFNDSNWSDTTYCAENLSLTVTETIYGYRSGVNYINVGSMVVHEIDGNGGYNKIATSGDFQSTGDIIARWDGHNVLIIGGSANFGGSIRAQISGDPGTNTITFTNNSATVTMASDQKVSIGGNGSNVLNFQGNQTTFNSDLTLERTTGSGKNIFNIADTKSVSFASGKMLNTLSGQTEIVFQGNSNGNSSGTFSGKAQTDNGTTTFVFSQDNGTYSISGELSANNGGQNIIDLSSKSATISTDLTLSGSPTGSGGNIIKIGDGKSLSFADSGSTNKTLSTTSGVSQVNFLNGSGTFKGDLNTSGGTMTFSFQDGGTYGVSGNFGASNTGKNIFDLSSQSVTISNDLTFSGSNVNAGAGNIINIGDAKSLSIQSGGGEQSLQTLDLVESTSMEHQETSKARFLQRVV